MSEDTVLTEVDPRGIATLTLNRPELHNAFDDNLVTRLTAEMRDLEANREVRVVRLAAAGRSFSAGADLNWMRRMAAYSMQENLRDAKATAGLMRTLHRTRKPTVAIVQGPVYGGGVGLVACCDIVVASTEASFCLSEVKLGLIPGVISPYLVGAIGRRAAQRYMLSAERFNAATAQALGLVHEVVDPDNLWPTADRISERLLQNGPEALAASKELVNAVALRPIDEAVIVDTAKRLADQRASWEGREGIAAFLEKRAPAWVKE
ncbi:MAG: enoyl-CoA hydratase/isomerase family protein [Gammaproteobacteria bacterium]|nr:enoyl-CoA hydratase/isomerase family protein [Gammaproteobacteria bacterium]